MPNPHHSRASAWRQTARSNAIEANLIKERDLPHYSSVIDRAKGVVQLQTQSHEPLQLGINSAVTQTAPVAAELIHKHSTRYIGYCDQEDRLLKAQNARIKRRWWRLRGWKISILTSADACASNPCKNGGTCEAKGSDFSCHCPEPYGGTTCEKGNCSFANLHSLFWQLMLLLQLYKPTVCWAESCDSPQQSCS